MDNRKEMYNIRIQRIKKETRERKKNKETKERKKRKLEKIRKNRHDEGNPVSIREKRYYCKEIAQLQRRILIKRWEIFSPQTDQRHLLTYNT